MKNNQLHKVAKEAKISALVVTEFMAPCEITVNFTAKIGTAIQILSAHGLTGIPVIDHHKRLVGMLSEYDLLMQAATKDLSSPIAFTKEVISLPATATLQDCLVALYKKKIRRIPILDENKKILGIVSRIDVLNRLIKPKISRATKK